MSKMLSKIADVPVPATENVIITRELLKKEYNIWWFGDNFRRLFFGKECQAIPASVTAFYLLQENARDAPIMDTLTTKGRVELGRILWHIKEQSDGRTGSLLTNSYTNIGYVDIMGRDGKTITVALGAGWEPDCQHWGIGISSVKDSREWLAGCQILFDDCWNLAPLSPLDVLAL